MTTPDYGQPGQGFYPPPPLPVGEALPEIVDRDLPCRKCAYNLRSLSSDGRCPECGSPVGLSLQGDLLRFSDPKWVETLRRGISLILYGVTIVVIWMIAFFLLGLVAKDLVPQLQALGLPLGLLISGLFVVGGWLLTMPDPSGIGEDRYGTSRKIIRVSLVVSIFSNFENLGMPYIHEPAALLALVIFSSACMIMGVVGYFAQTNYLSKLALRIPDQKMSDRAKFVMYALGIPYILMVLMLMMIGIAAGGFGWRLNPNNLMVFGCSSAILGLAILIFGLMYLRLLTNFGKGLKAVAELARRTWAAGQAQQG